MANQAQIKAPRRVRIGILVLVALLHIAAGFGIVRMFTPDLTATIVNRAFEAFTMIITTPPPEPKVKEEQRPDAGAAGEEARKARPREVSAPKQTLPKRPLPVPPVSSTGKDNASGARARGEGTGGGGEGTGMGSGLGGSGQGGSGLGGIATHGLEKIAGDINSARDYRKKTRELRIGQSVTILLTVGTDGRVKDCRATAASPDAEADATTCRLATERFRFRPAMDRNGNPVIGKFAWRQRWFY